MYITDSKEGGYSQKDLTNDIDRKEQKIYAGVSYDDNNNPIPTAGRYCEYVHRTIDQSHNSISFESFFSTLRLECDENGEPAKFFWYVEEDTPDTVYYQVKYHFN